jgi:hypothetical protein
VKSGNYEDYFPSDLYYADIYNSTGGFSNWDVDLDGKYAEYPTDMDNIDVIPDLHLGKLPANNAEEVTWVVNKIIKYKAHNKMTKKILQCGGDTFTGDSIYEGEYANTKVMEKLPGYKTTRLWGSHPNPDYDTKALTKLNIKRGFKNCVDFVDMSGHGNWALWGTHPPNDEDTWIPPETIISKYDGFLYTDFDLYIVNNGEKLPVCVYNSCSNNKYSEKPDCFGWATVRKEKGGGIADYAASGIGYGAQGTDETKRVMGWMEVRVFDELVTNKILGQCWTNCVAGYHNTFQSGFQMSDWKTMLEFSMFGDPTLVIEDGDNPKSIPVNIPLNIPLVNRLTEKFADSFPLLARFIYQILEKLN